MTAATPCAPGARRRSARRTALAALALLLGCPSGDRLAPAPGLPEYQARAAVPVPGGRVHVMGGNLLVHRADLVVDTRLGPVEAGATYNSSTAAWTWSFELRYDGRTFHGADGAVHDLRDVPDGAAVPGTRWVRLDADRLRSKGGRVHVFASGHLRRIHWASGAYPALEITHADVGGRPRPVAVRQCLAADDCRPVFDLSYDASGAPVRVVDRAGREARFAYRGGRLREARDALDRAQGWPGFRYAYDAAGRLVAQTNSEGERVEVAYTGRRVSRVCGVGAGDPCVRFAYPARRGAAYETRVTDPLGHVFRYRYDAQRRMLELESADTGDRWQLAWQGRRPVSETHPDGSETRWVYQDDDPVERTDPSGNVVRFTYAPAAEDREHPWQRPRAEVRDDLGLVERRRYDAQGRLIEVRNGEDEVVRAQTWRADGSLAERSTPSGVLVFGAWGEHGHPLEVEVGGRPVTNRYDAVGNLLSGFDGRPELGGVMSRGYDEDRNLAEILVEDQETAAAAAVRLVHRSDGRLLAVRRPGGGDHELRYDALGRLVELRERAEDAWHVTRFERDASGRTTAVERPNGMRRETAYDAQGRALRVRWLRGGALESEVALTWEAGRLVELDDSTYAAPERRQYDAAGRVVRIDFPGGERLWQSWDARSRPVGRVFEATGFVRTVTRTWDAADREAVVAEQGRLLASRTWSAGRPSRTLRGNGLERRFAWDAATGRLQGTTTLDAAGRTVASTQVRHDFTSGVPSVLRVVEDTATHRGVVASTHGEYWFAPPFAGGPAGEEPGRRILAWTDGTEVRGYRFDALSHRVDESSGRADFVWGPQRRRLRRAPDGPGGTPLDYRYDAAGFVVARGGVPLRWSAAGRLTGWGSRASFVWDALGRPVARSLDGEARRYLFGGRVEADAAGRPLAMEVDDVRIDLKDGSRLYRHRDFRRNVQFTTDDAGDVRSLVRYAPYGVAEVVGDAGDRRRFAGGLDLGGLSLLGARVYDPAASRFLSPDPLFQLLNDAAYTLGNPVAFVDASGLSFAAVDPLGYYTDAELELTIGTLATLAAGYGLMGNVLGAGVLGLSAGLVSVDLALRHAFPSHDELPESGGGFGVRGSGRPLMSSGDGLAAPGTCAPTALGPPGPPGPWTLCLAGLWLLLGVGAAVRARRRRPRPGASA